MSDTWGKTRGFDNGTVDTSKEKLKWAVDHPSSASIVEAAFVYLLSLTDSQLAKTRKLLREELENRK